MEDSLGKRLERYYSEHRRVLPWRSDPTPYHVWISEVMLQQTRVETVKGYYLRFLDALPDVASLAEVSEDQLLKLWEGLGYYSRAKNLSRSAKIIMEKYGGQIPSSREELLTLPGIGLYVSAAISAISFHQKEAAVDGNLIRIYSRLFAVQVDPTSAKDRKKIEDVYCSLMDIDPSVFNQALMDIGQTVCIPNGSPRCADCPFAGMCKAHQKGQETDYPRRTKQRAKNEEKRTIVLLYSGDSLFLDKRPSKGLLSNLYEPINLLGHYSESEVRSFLEKSGYVLASLEDIGHAKHVFSHKIWDMIGFRAVLSLPSDDPRFVSPSKRNAEISIPSAFSYFLS
ncbi:MAG: A/G-specific adenine glycosylase [Candidatus Enteromonas sp.]|nr:A/G-specific adenine glycosylase [Candidatus Enteromonas sp.]MDY6093886.1 A/G-specific adenine glycosylase [Candidatus Enteromonas sp.]